MRNVALCKEALRRVVMVVDDCEVQRGPSVAICMFTLAVMACERKCARRLDPRTAVSVEDAIKREYERWMVPADADGEDPDAGNTA